MDRTTGAIMDERRDGPPAVRRVAQLANFMGPGSGGLRVVVEQLGAAHVRAGGERLVLIPGPATTVTESEGEVRRTVDSPRLPGPGRDYRVLLRRREVVAALEDFGPDLIEVHDQLTLTWVAAWARERGIPSVLYCHERLDLVAADLAGGAAAWFAVAGRLWAGRLAPRFDAIVCASSFAAQAFGHRRPPGLHLIPFGVDLEIFHPRRRTLPPGGSPERPGGGPLRLVFAGRLAPEKHPGTALDVLAHLRDDGVEAHLTIAGAGPLGPALQRRVAKERLPVTFRNHVADRLVLAALLADADVALAPGPRETFGLSVLEAMACATPVVVSARGGSQELLAPGAGRAAMTARALADAVREVTADPATHAAARRAARRRAEEFSWDSAARRAARMRLAAVEAAAALAVADATPESVTRGRGGRSRADAGERPRELRHRVRVGARSSSQGRGR